MTKRLVASGRHEVMEGLWHVEFYLNGTLFAHDDYDSTARVAQIHFPAHRYPHGIISWRARPFAKEKPFGRCIYCEKIDKEHPEIALDCVV